MKTKKRIAVIIAAAIAALTLSVSAFAFTGCGEPTIVLNGSTSMKEVIEALSEAYMEENNVRVTYAATGSGTGIEAVENGTADIGLASRDLKSEETEKGLVATPIAIDAVVMVVNKSNTTTTNVTKAQLAALYTSGTAIDSVVTKAVGREEGSGTRDCFDSTIDIESYSESVALQNSTGGVVSTVAGNASAIGYVSLSSVDASQVTAVQYEGVTASEATVKDKSYKLTRNFNLVLPEGGADSLSEAAKAFYEFCLSEEGQAIIATCGVVTVK